MQLIGLTYEERINSGNNCTLNCCWYNHIIHSPNLSAADLNSQREKNGGPLLVERKKIVIVTLIRSTTPRNCRGSVLDNPFVFVCTYNQSEQAPSISKSQIYQGFERT